MSRNERSKKSVRSGRQIKKIIFKLTEAESAYAAVKKLANLKIVGLMAMLPDADDEGELRRLATDMRKLYDKLRATDGNITRLSMGMSGDRKICVECGSNMIRLGTAIFGARNYNL